MAFIEELVFISWQEAPTKTSWTPMTTIKGGKKFVLLDVTDKRFQRYCQNSFAMVDHITFQRNVAVNQLMRKVEIKDEVAASSAAGPPVLKRARREIYDDIDEWTTVQLDTESGPKFMNVLTAAQARDKLWVELSAENMTLLNAQPASPTSEPEHVVPNVSEPHVKWIPSRQQLRIVWWDAAAQEEKSKSPTIKQGDDFQERIDQTARELEEQYMAKHSARPRGSRPRRASSGGA